MQVIIYIFLKRLIKGMMLMFYTWNWTSWKKGISLIFLVGLFIFSTYFSSSYIFNPVNDVKQTEAITKSLNDDQKIALTFNVSWGDDVIIQILDILKEKKVKATFFINGEWALRNEEIAKLIISENHEVGLLGFYNEPYENKSKRAIETDITNGVETLNKLKYDPVTYVRPPENRFNETVVKHIHSLGYRTVFWSLFANVNRFDSIDKTSDYITSRLSSGDIILFLADDNLTNTSKVLSRIIDQKLDEGFEFVSVTELLSPADIEIKPIE
ncbi:polysaccharide deacetylase family protein [Bacillaceae bacterium W0354]